jgi:hypothetical protein
METSKNQSLNMFSLAGCFRLVKSVYDDVENGKSQTEEDQEKILSAIRSIEENRSEFRTIFSPNEELEDISTNDLK